MTPTLFPIIKRGFRGGGARDGRSKKGRPNRNSDMPGTGVPVCLFRSGMWNVRDRRIDGWRCGVPLDKKGRADGTGS